MIEKNSFRQKTISGVGWSSTATFIKQAINFVVSIILARLLSPDQFGLMGMILVFINFATIFTDLGFGAALIQRKDVTDDHYSSIFWVNVASGLFLTILLSGASPLIAKFYGEPLLVPLSMVVSINFVIGSLKIVHVTLMEKQLKFRLLAFVEVTAVIISGTVGIIAALAGLEVWSLALKSVILTLASVILYWIVDNWRPQFRLKREAVKDLWGFSSNLLGFSSVNYWLRNADNLIVGRFLGTASLGLYAKAYEIMLMPLAMVSSPIGKVMFPAFAAIQEERDRVAKIYLKITSTVALVTFPIMLGLLSVSEHFVLGLFGSNWEGMIPVLRVFCVVGLIQSIGTLNGNLYLSQGRTNLQFKVGTVVGLLGIISMVIGLRWGLYGVAYCYGIFSVLVAYPSIYIAVNLVGLKVLQVVKSLFGVFLCAATMAIAVRLLSYLLPANWPHGVCLAVQVAAGGVVYFWLVKLFNLRAYQNVHEIMVEQWQRLIPTAKS